MSSIQVQSTIVNSSPSSSLCVQTPVKTDPFAVVHTEQRVSSEDQEEELLRQNPNRFVLFPIKYPEIFRRYKVHVAAVWSVEEVDLAADDKDWKSLSDDERYFIKVLSSCAHHTCSH